MSDDIKERLDTLARLGGGAAVLIDAKARIEALEAQLAAAREALRISLTAMTLASGFEVISIEFEFRHAIDAVRAALASLTAPAAAPTPIMQAAAKAAKTVEGWSDAKRRYANRVTGAPAAAPTREEIAREPGETAPKDGRRIILFWEFPGLPMHFELGWWKDGSWRNTYGLPFSGEPHHWFDPAIIALKSAPAK